MHTTSESCCPETVVIQIGWCGRTDTYRVRGQWCPEQLQFFDDAVHDVEVLVKETSEIRQAVVQVLRHFLPLLRLSERQTHRGIHPAPPLGVPLVVHPPVTDGYKAVGGSRPDDPPLPTVAGNGGLEG